MARIVFIGAGDVELLRRALSALLLASELHGELEVVLHDDDPGRLATAETLVRALDAEAGAAAKIRSVFDRRQALADADFVVSRVHVQRAQGLTAGAGSGPDPPFRPGTLLTAVSSWPC
ncbi:hypothetical protein ABGB18_25035 [Nonomuraea sp. B12E4]|uniref:family 4 glycosyl hydrolase n=1 Tax=Nonomuraea sp. B12E4 TaxID=3153564 RepID=UPI00325CDE95